MGVLQMTDVERPLHRLRRSPSPVARGRMHAAEAGPPRILPCEAGEGNHAQHGGGGVRNATGPYSPQEGIDG